MQFKEKFENNLKKMHFKVISVNQMKKNTIWNNF